ncbi:flagellar hook assembly protein FlgD [Metabacillus sediminilitoris]|uniref:Flagellar hook assembly protein FlgD n=1 Tax=Metabacillus sediminilitoris TaxID=2567941 RepID=A0A4S4C5H9_9BACI|nr:flagellar hook assembly protein FlgD [Metabacillus sediminilitoris]QGQ46853.1 flagellar hook assembly protein FlgD [Metabacillus sediminilitoris]THF83001.1 flagellar hook assembly protein FlgD [Metabacillus sediminilitoris]
MTTIDSSLLLTNKPTTTSTGNSSLGKDEFLKILMTQLQNQDPLNPMQDKEFIAQMAQFSTLEQTTNMASMLEKFLNIQSDSLLKYSELIGKQVDWKNDEESGSGIVKSIKQNGTEIVLELESGEEVSSNSVIEVSKAE